MDCFCLRGFSVTRLKSKFFEYLRCFENDKLGSILKSFIYVLCTFFLLTLPIFTYREGFNILSVIGASLISFLALLYIVFRGKLYLDIVIVPYIVFCIYSVLSFAFTGYHFSNLRSVIFIHCIMMVLYQIIKNFKCHLFFILIFIISSKILALFIFVNNFDSILSLDFERFGSEFGNLNSLALVFATSLFLSLYLLMRFRKFSILFLILCLFDFLFIFLTGSRGPLVISATGLLLFSLAYFKGKKRLIFIGILILAILLFFFVIQLPYFEYFRERVIGAIVSLISGGESGDGSSNSRFFMIKEGMYWFSKSPVFGNGFYSFSVLSDQNVYSHSNYSEMLCDFGILGFLFWLIPPLYISWRDLKAHDSFILIFTISFVFLGSIFSVLFVQKFFVIPLALFFGASSNYLPLPGIEISLFKSPHLTPVYGMNPFILFERNNK